MREGKFREIFEECLTAVLDGRRTVEDCLSLYPAIASELEPLLRTSLEISDAYQAESPSWHVQERIRNRVLAAAQARARSRTLVSGINLAPTSWRARHWGGLGAAAAAAVAAVFLISVSLIGGSGGGNGGNEIAGTDVITLEPVVAAFKSDVDHARQLLLAENRIEPAQIQQIATAQDALITEYPDFDSFNALTPETRQAARETVSGVIEIFTPLVEADATSPELDPVRNLLGQAKLLEEQWGAPATDAPIPTDEPTPSDTPAPTEVPTEVPAETGDPEPTPTKAPTPTLAPEPTETPSDDSDPVRDLQ